MTGAQHTRVEENNSLQNSNERRNGYCGRTRSRARAGARGSIGWSSETMLLETVLDNTDTAWGMAAVSSNARPLCTYVFALLEATQRPRNRMSCNGNPLRKSSVAPPCRRE